MTTESRFQKFLDRAKVEWDHQTPRFDFARFSYEQGKQLKDDFSDTVKSTLGWVGFGSILPDELAQKVAILGAVGYHGVKVTKAYLRWRESSGVRDAAKMLRDSGLKVRGKIEEEDIQDTKAWLEKLSDSDRLEVLDGLDRQGRGIHPPKSEAGTKAWLYAVRLQYSGLNDKYAELMEALRHLNSPPKTIKQSPNTANTTGSAQRTQSAGLGNLRKALSSALDRLEAVESCLLKVDDELRTAGATFNDHLESSHSGEEVRISLDDAADSVTRAYMAVGQASFKIQAYVRTLDS